MRSKEELEALNVEADKRRRLRMAALDAWPAEYRELVHEYGLSPVKAFIDCGVKKPNQIRHLIETVLNEFSPTRGSNSFQGAHRGKGLVA